MKYQFETVKPIIKCWTCPFVQHETYDLFCKLSFKKIESNDPDFFPAFYDPPEWCELIRVG